MEDDQVFEAGAALEANVRDRSRPGSNHDSVRAKTMIAASGSSHKNLAPSTAEESPLLPNGSSKRQNGTTGDDEDGEEDADARWLGEVDFEGMPWWKRPSVYWLLPAYAVFALAFGGIYVPRIDLIQSLICREYLADKSIANPSFNFGPAGLTDNCQIAEVQALSSRFLLYMGLIGGILGAIASPKIGALSDRYGRKPLMVLTTTGGLCGELMIILAARYPDTVHYSWVLVGAVADGMCGSFVASSAMTHSYATDCTAPAKRAIAFGYFHASLFSGVAIGPILAAWLVVKTDNPLSPFYFAFIVHLFFMAFIVLILPESLAKKRQMAAREKHSMESSRDRSSFSSRLRSLNLLAPLKILYPTGEGTSPQLRMNLLLLSAVDTILFGTAMASMTVVILYAEFEFGWGVEETSILFSIANSSRVFALVVFIPLLNYLVRTRYRNRVRRESGIELVEKKTGSDGLDIWTIRASVLFEIIGYGGYCLVRTGPLFIMSSVFASFGGIGSPTLQSALTKHVPHDRVGQLLGASGLLHALARVIWPTAITMIYSSTVATFPQAIFVSLVGGFGVALLCSFFIRPHVHLDEPASNPSTGQGIPRDEDDATLR